jgi:hypothetical protein
MVANKTDVVPYESLPAHTRAAIEEVSSYLFKKILFLLRTSELPQLDLDLISSTRFEGRSQLQCGAHSCQ